MKVLFLAIVLCGALSSCIRPQTQPTDPGDRLLYMAKAVADSGRIDDPATVSSLVHITLTRTSHHVMGPAPDGCQGGGHLVNDEYSVTGNNWFQPLPTGKQHMMAQTGMFDSSGKQIEKPIGNPVIYYGTSGALDCAKPSQSQPRQAWTSAAISFDNIPAYTCISVAQIRAVFPDLGGAVQPTDGAVGADFGYWSTRDSTELIEFTMTFRYGMADSNNQPACLKFMSIGHEYPINALHKLDTDS